jgi:hypothetical protein
MVLTLLAIEYQDSELKGFCRLTFDLYALCALRFSDNGQPITDNNAMLYAPCVILSPFTHNL